MTTTLTDRYVAAVVRRVSDQHRRAVEQKLRATIAVNTEARVALGEVPDQAEYATLADLGHPARRATLYADRAAVLIGPETYPDYVRALGVLCAIVLPVVYILNDIGYWARGEGVWAVLFGPVGITLTAAMYLVVCVTVVFVIMDRAGNKQRGGTDSTQVWTPDALRE
ncbi:hypothetical protein ACQP0C_04325 [Nocardia sp. CA-129566]|uniref:hypothetical protein n=1 Tax=Nocardia sp. CA-129566 TaxID=3239976 RepID=UPI003D978637